MATTCIPEQTLSFPVTGQNLKADRFGDLLDSGRTLLVFLRHLG
jgi:hypothetical protein